MKITGTEETNTVRPALASMIILSKFSNFPDELSKNDELREHKLSRSDCTWKSR